MPTSVIEDGKVKDISYKYPHRTRPMGSTNIVNVYLDSVYIGQIHKLRSGYAVVSRDPNPFNGTEGFKTRWKALQFLLKLREVNNDHPKA